MIVLVIYINKPVSVKYISGVIVQKDEANGIDSNYQFELKHQDIIKKSGRYPHQNAILNRESSAEEIWFLSLPDSSF